MDANFHETLVDTTSGGGGHIAGWLFMDSFNEQLIYQYDNRTIGIRQFLHGTSVSWKPSITLYTMSELGFSSFLQYNPDFWDVTIRALAASRTTLAIASSNVIQFLKLKKGYLEPDYQVENPCATSTSHSHPFGGGNMHFNEKHLVLSGAGGICLFEKEDYEQVYGRSSFAIYIDPNGETTSSEGALLEEFYLE